MHFCGRRGALGGRITFSARIAYRTEQEQQPADWTMARTATERAGLRAVKTVRVSRRSTGGVEFYALDGALCVLIEAESEDDVLYLCRDVRLEFLGFCAR